MSTTNIDLNTCPQSKGVVSSTGSGVENGFLIFIIGSDSPYWLYRASGNYQNIRNALANGSAVTIYHSATKDKHQYYTIYQVNNANGIVYSKEEYEGKEQLAGRFIGLPAGVILLGVVFFTTRKKIRQQRAEKNITSQ